MYRLLISLIAIVICSTHVYSRKQWTERQAWKWYDKVGIIKGFNQPEPPYPGIPLEQILKKAHDMGLNSVRFWTSRDADATISIINRMKATAKPYGMTLSPVLVVPVSQKYFTGQIAEQKEERQKVKTFIKKVLGTFAKDEQITLWDIYNEPGQINFTTNKDEKCIRELQLVSDIADMCYEMNPVQAITSSIYWRSDILDEHKNELSKKCFEVESKMDIHNYHNYSCSRRGYNDKIMALLERSGHRPSVCTECITRVNGSGVGRTLTEFSKHHTSFYIWGLYANDANWEVSWGRSTYYPYEPAFHDLLYPDGEPYDWAEIEMIRQYKYTDKDEQSDPGVEKTDRWTLARAWRWMSTGPVKGKSVNNVEDAIEGFNNNNYNEYNSINVKLEFQEYKKDSKQFFVQIDSLLKLAHKAGITVMPTLLSDKDAHYLIEDLASYEKSVIDRYYQSRDIQAWDLYYHPGEKISNKPLLTKLVTRLFQECRYAFANQPLTMTPYVSVKRFKKDFDYISALKHGRRNGWRQLHFDCGASDSLTYQIWCMSDVLSFSSAQPAEETGWLMSLAFRFGRPLFCTDWRPGNDTDKMLENFSRSHVYWYQNAPQPTGDIRQFKFMPITTKH